jgi:hypothetical protein
VHCMISKHAPAVPVSCCMRVIQFAAMQLATHLPMHQFTQVQ